MLQNNVETCGFLTEREHVRFDLEGAFGRRAVTERAKGVLMERHSVDDADAFEMLRDQSRRANTKLADVAAAVVEGHRLLPKQPDVLPNRALVLRAATRQRRPSLKPSRG